MSSRPKNSPSPTGKLDGAKWGSGLMSAGHQGARVKNNQQLAQTDPLASSWVRYPGGPGPQLAVHVVRAAVAVLPPMFNRYSGGELRHPCGRSHPQYSRHAPAPATDLSCTLFLCDPGEYDGGELCVEDAQGNKSVKLPAGHWWCTPPPACTMSLRSPAAPAPSFFWLQSLVRDNDKRALLFDLDVGIQQLSGDHPDHPAAVRLTGVYHNLLRQWADT
jgi:PKHD-type hydroxylase